MSERAGRKTLPGNTRVLETKNRLQHGDPNPGSRVTPPDVEATREAILAGTCPFCGKTGFKMLAGHTYRAHGVDRMELRAMGGFVLKESICAPEVSDGCRQRTVDRVARGELRRGNPSGPGSFTLSAEGKRRQAEKNRRRAERMRAEYEANPDRCVVCDAAIPFDKHNNTTTCSDACYKARAAAKQREFGERQRAAKPVRLCPVCSEPIPYRARTKPTKTCSAECGAKLRSGGPGECVVCGGAVERQPRRTPAKTCGPACLRRLFAERDAKRRKNRAACAICGEQIPASMPASAKTCGTACLTVYKSRVMAAWRNRAPAAHLGSEDSA